VKRFWDKVNKTDSCWNWISYIQGNYGKFWLNGGPKLAHRVSWELYNDAIPKDMYICHKCDNTICVNPNHLFIGTPKDNTLDMIKKNRQSNRKGEDNGCSKLSKRVSNIILFHSVFCDQLYN